MKEFYDLWVNHQLRHASIPSSLWVIRTTALKRRPVVNQFCEKWVKALPASEWDLDKCFADFDQYLDSTHAKQN